MKRVFAALLLVIGLSSQAQEQRGPQGGPHAGMEKLTPAQRRDLRVKEMTLQLDLSSAQQKDMAKIMENADANREKFKAQFAADKGKELSSEEIYNRKSTMLDSRIAEKQSVKNVLNEEQYKKWEKSRQDHKKHGKHGKFHKKHRGSKESK